MIVEALTLLGLSWSDKDCTQAITRAWKLKLLCAHPDKNSSCDAVQQTQRLNQAKEVLLANLKEPVGTSTILEQLERLKKQQEDMIKVFERMKQEMHACQKLTATAAELARKERDRHFVEVAKKVARLFWSSGPGTGKDGWKASSGLD